MKKILLLNMVLGMFLSACEMRSFELAPEYNEAGRFILDSEGSFDETNNFDLRKVLEDLEIPENSEITEISIQSISVVGQTLSGNSATGFNLQGSLTYDTETVNLFSSNNIPITNTTIQEVAVTNLNPAAIELLKDFMSTTIYTYFGFPVTTGFVLTDEFITIRVNGTTNPGGTAYAHLQFDIRINFSLTYNYCVESFPFMGDPCGPL